MLLTNPRGLLLARDELAGWIGSFDRYAGGKGGADAAHWLSMHNGESVVVDRKTGNPRTIYVPMASVSVCGGIQPTILHRELGIEHRESGLAARLLLTCPPRKLKRWTEADIDPTAEAEIARLVDRLYELQPTIGDDDELRPVVVGLAPDAKSAWKAYYNAHAQEQLDLAGELSAAWSKLEENAARLALVIYFVRWAADDSSLQSAEEVDVKSMGAGITLTQWFKREARHVYAIMSETDEECDRRQLVDWIDRKGGSVTPREVQQGHRRIATSTEAETALQELLNAGYGHWEPSPAGRRGQPTRRFILSTASTVYGNTPNAEKNRNTVDVDGASNVHFQSERQDWEAPLALIVNTSVPADSKWHTVYDITNGEYDWISEAFATPPKPAEPRCRCHKKQRWWRSVYGGHRICGICHPPVTPVVLREWVQEMSRKIK